MSSAESSPSLPIALDAMGGDLGVQPLIDGAVAAVLEDGASVVVVGTDEVKAHIERAAHARLTFVPATDVITMDDAPAKAVKKRQSSMRVTCDLVEQGKARAAVSVANSGAMMAVSSFVFGRLKGVSRPCIGTVLPSFAPGAASGAFGRTLLVDAGANSVCDAQQLCQFGVLGSVYLDKAWGVPKPTVAVLSNGEEEHKGTPLTREALALLKKTDLNVVGFCEGRDLTTGEFQVMVTDGFTGNVILKTAEGVFSFVGRVVKDTFGNGTLVDKMGGLLSKPGWARIRAEIDPREFGAAPLLGLQKPGFIAHGKSDAHAVRCAIRAARRFADNDVTGQMQAAIERNQQAWEKAKEKEKEKQATSAAE